MQNRRGISSAFLDDLTTESHIKTLATLSKSTIKERLPDKEQLEQFGKHLRQYWMACYGKSFVESPHVTILRAAVAAADWTRIAGAIWALLKAKKYVPTTTTTIGGSE